MVRSPKATLSYLILRKLTLDQYGFTEHLKRRTAGLNGLLRTATKWHVTRPSVVRHQDSGEVDDV